MLVSLSRAGFIPLIFTAIIALPVFAQDADRRSLIERAKKEGELIWYTTAGLQDSKPMADEFQKDYPFIKPSVVRAGSGVLVNRILNEARAQKVFFDIFNTNHESILPLKKRGLIGRYVSPEAKFYDEDLRDNEGYWHSAYVIPWFLGYNTRMIKKDEVPKTYLDLLSPKWKGKKIAVGSENGAIILSGLMKVWGRDKAVGYFKQLAAQDPVVQAGSPSNRIQLLSAGEFPMTLAAGNTLQSFASRGAPIDWIALEPVFVQVNAIMIAAQAPIRTRPDSLSISPCRKKARRWCDLFTACRGETASMPNRRVCSKDSNASCRTAKRWKMPRRTQALQRNI